MNRRLISVMLVGALLFALSVLPLVAANSADNQPGVSRLQTLPSITVANFSFEITSVEQGPTFNSDYFLGSTGDGRDWLIIRIHGRNTSSEKQEIHSDKIQLLLEGEKIKQTGSESDSVAGSLGVMNIGGSFPHEIESSQEFDFVQVYKVDPIVTGFSLWFDFSGEWTLPLDPSMITRHDAQPGGEKDKSWVITTKNYKLTLIGATKSETFAGPFHLGQHPDGAEWVVVSWEIENNGDDSYDPDGADFRLIANGESIEISEETNSVASEIGMKNPGVEIPKDSSNTSVAVYEVNKEQTDFALEIHSLGTWYLNLSPVISAAAGDPNAVLESNQLDLAVIYGDEDSASYIPTAAPTPTQAPTSIPLPTSVPAPTQPPAYGSEDNPAGLYEAIVVGGFTVSLDGVELADSLNYGSEYPAGGFRFLLIAVTVTRTGDTGGDVGPGDFSITNLDNGKSYGGELATLEGVDLAPGEYTFGQIAFEVPVSATNFQVTFRPSLAGDTGHWNFQLLLNAPHHHAIARINPQGKNSGREVI